MSVNSPSASSRRPSDLGLALLGLWLVLSLGACSGPSSSPAGSDADVGADAAVLDASAASDSLADAPAFVDLDSAELGQDVGPDGVPELPGGVDTAPDLPVCEPDCEGRICGGDGCGGLCGRCPYDEACDVLGDCVAVAGRQGIDSFSVFFEVGEGESRFSSYPCHEEALPGSELIILVSCPNSVEMDLYFVVDALCPEDPENATLMVMEGAVAPERCVYRYPGEDPDARYVESVALVPGTPYFFVVDTPDGFPAKDLAIDVFCGTCEGSCDGIECGGDGCGGECPNTCAAGEGCNYEGLCVPCDGSEFGDRDCGWSECSGLYRACEAGAVCYDGRCVDEEPFPQRLRVHVLEEDGTLASSHAASRYRYDAAGRLTALSYDSGPANTLEDMRIWRLLTYDEHGNALTEGARHYVEGQNCAWYGPRRLFRYTYGPTAGGLEQPLTQDVDYTSTGEDPDERWTFYYNDSGHKERAELDGGEHLGPPDGTVDAIFTYAFDDAGRVASGEVDGVHTTLETEWLGLFRFGPSGQELGVVPIASETMEPGSPLTDAGPPDGEPEARWVCERDELGVPIALSAYEDGELRWDLTFTYEGDRLVEVLMQAPEGWAIVYRYE